MNKKIKICNLLSDFILSKIGLDTDTKIQVADCHTFYVINGQTNSKDPLIIKDIIDEFNTKFEDFLGKDIIQNTIDVINYQIKLPAITKLKYKFYNTPNSLYPIDAFQDGNDDQIKSFSNLSTFPHGHSFSMGRSLLYKMKNISYNAFNLGYIKWLEMEVNLNNSDDDIINIKHNLTPIKYDFIKSAILDVFDVSNIDNMNINKYDMFKETLHSEIENKKISKIEKDFIII